MMALIMIMITINGTSSTLPGLLDLATLLSQQGYEGMAVAVAVNGRFIPKSIHAKTTIAPGDAIEILAPMQGG